MLLELPLYVNVKNDDHVKPTIVGLRHWLSLNYKLVESSLFLGRSFKVN